MEIAETKLYIKTCYLVLVYIKMTQSKLRLASQIELIRALHATLLRSFPPDGTLDIIRASGGSGIALIANSGTTIQSPFCVK